MSILKSLLYIRNEKALIPSNILRLLGILSHKKVFIGPFKVVIDTTNRCDMGCAMCWYHPPIPDREDISKDMPLERFTSLMSELRGIHTSGITLCGEGETFMHPDIFKMIKVARANSLEVEIITNAYHLDRDKIAFLVEHGIKKILVSLHCGDAKTFKKVRPLKSAGDYNRIVGNLTSLQQMKGKRRFPLLYITNVISSLNCDNVFEMVKLAKDLNADKVLFKPLLLWPDQDKGLIPTKQQTNKLIDDLTTLLPRLKTPGITKSYIDMLKFRNIDKSSFSTRGCDFCYIPWIQPQILLTGDVVGCVYLPNGMIPLGNIYNSSFKEIWYGKKYQSFRKGLLNPSGCAAIGVYPFLSK